MQISETDAISWLERYRAGWEQRDAVAIVTLFTTDAEFRERRFGAPLGNFGSLEDYWRSRIGRFQRDVSFAFQLWAVREREAYCSFQAQFVWLPINGIMQLDGVARMRFSQSGDRLLCDRFEEWMDHREA